MSAQLGMSKRCYSERSKEIKDWKASYIPGEGNWSIATLIAISCLTATRLERRSSCLPPDSKTSCYSACSCIVICSRPHSETTMDLGMAFASCDAFISNVEAFLPMYEDLNLIPSQLASMLGESAWRMPSGS